MVPATLLKLRVVIPYLEVLRLQEGVEVVATTPRAPRTTPQVLVDQVGVAVPPGLGIPGTLRDLAHLDKVSREELELVLEPIQERAVAVLQEVGPIPQVRGLVVREEPADLLQ